MFAAMSFQDNHLRLIDQRALPHNELWIEAYSLEQIAQAIENMTVRGAPAIATAAAFALALDALSSHCKSWQEYRPKFEQNCTRLHNTRPTAVNLSHSLHAVRELFRLFPIDANIALVRSTLREFAKNLELADLTTCKAIGQHGAEMFPEKNLRIMTHCNTGSLATAGYGTALGVIRALNERGFLEHVYVDETRPYLQGSRLTAYELKVEGIPYSIQTDSAAAYLMKYEKVDFVVVGADRIAANGDTANKIGTYSLAIVAKYHKIPFYVAAPLSTFDPSISNGSDIPIEMRSELEVVQHAGHAVAPLGAKARNPSFDISPAELISGIITEHGVLKPPFHRNIETLLNKVKFMA